jgi:uncharacterized phage protein gp47/JayE
MAIFRNFQDVVINLIEYLRLVQPNLDTKPGTVSRDLFIDSPAQQLASLYAELRNISSLQSFFSATGTDLNKLALNYGVRRASGTASTGVAVFTTNNLDLDIFIPQGSVVTANNGITFQTTVAITLSASSSNVYKANATRLRSDLDLIGNVDQFAVEINVQSLITGTSGNIGRFALSSQNVPGISNITNLQSFSGGTDQESDAEFRSRILSIFAGSNTGTALGYETTVKSVDGVQDAIVIVPGDPLLIRDGTQTSTDSSGNLIVSDPGTGGKVDIYLLGSQLQSEIDSFIYNDQSGRGDPTDPSNDIILGQNGQDTTLDASQRRVTLISEDNLPFQPVENITSVVGSSSGANFIESFVDSSGAIKGNYTLTKDDGDFGGSPFGFDKLHWISNKIELDNEEVIKGIFNGIDSLGFSDIEEIRDITQDVLVTNENSTINSSNRTQITLKHTPIRSVSRVVNLTTGERYVIEDQNPDGSAGELNTTGNILISGSTLPIGTDVLQVDYTWVKPFDNAYDFDNLKVFNVNRTTQDSVDWGFGNLVKNEPDVIDDDGYGNFTITVLHPISKILSVNTFETSNVTVESGVISASSTVSNIIDVRRISDGAELFNTDLRDGVLSGTNSIILPSDSLAEDGDMAILRFNTVDYFTFDGYDAGTFDDNIITLTPGVVGTGGASVLVNYIANVSTLLPEAEIDLLPAVKSENKFLFNSEIVGEQPTSNILDVDGNFIQNIRRAPSSIRVTTNSTVSSGNMVVSGVTVKKVKDALVTVTASSGLEIDLAPAIKKDMGVSSLSSNIKLVKIQSVERVNVSRLGIIESVDNVYDIVNYKINDNSYDLDTALEDSNLTATQIILPATVNNEDALLNTGDIVRVTFYYINIADSESLFFSRSGTLVTNKLYFSVSRIAVGSGFQNAASQIIGNFLIQNYNQPLSNTVYDVDYNYVAPKENERITVTFNSNIVIDNATLAIEAVRPITADVLIKAAKAKDIDVTVRIVLLPEFVNQEQTVIQDAIDSVTAFLNANSLGTTVDASDVVNALYSVSGIDRVQIINFSTGDSGNLLSIVAAKNEYLRAGTIKMTAEER